MSGLTRDEQDVLLHRVGQVDWLVLAVAALELVVVAGGPARLRWPALAALGGYTVFCAWLRLPACPLRAPAPRIGLAAAVGIAFVTAAAALSGGAGSPLVTLYLAPLLLAAAALPRPAVAGLFACVGAGVALLLALDGVPPGDWAFAAHALGYLAPLAVAAWLVWRLAAALAGSRRALRDATERDALTGLASRQSFEQAWRATHAAAEATGQPYSLLLVDLDQLHRVNEAHGRSAGDAALVALASAIQRAVRDGDLAARHGGDEFAVLLPGGRAELGASVAQRIRNNFFGCLFQAGDRLQRGTAGVGAASYPRDGRSRDELLAAAERQLRQDKELRRKAG